MSGLERTRLRRFRAAGLILAALLALGSVGGPSARAASGGLDAAQAELDGILARMEASVAERDRLRTQLSSLLQQIDANRRALESAATGAAEARADIAALRADIAVRQTAIDRRAATAYISGAAGGLEVAFGAASVADFQAVLAYLNATARSDRELIDGLAMRRVELRERESNLASQEDRLRAAQEGLERAATEVQGKLQGQMAAVAQLERVRVEAESLVRRLDQSERAAARAAIERTDPSPDPSTPPPSPDPSPLPSDPGPEAVKQLIEDYFEPLGQDEVDTALCVAERESNFDPLAVNPVSGAAGVYQFLPSTWEDLSGPAGWGGHSVFEAEANVAVAAWTVENYGWSPWESQSESCGI